MVSYRVHILFLWSHRRIIQFFKRTFFRFMNSSSTISWISCSGHLWKLGFHTRIIYDFFGFIQESYMISLILYKDHTLIYGCILAFLELFIYDFSDFMLGSCMKTWISYKDHIWFLWFHTRIVLRNRVWSVWNHIWFLYEIKENSTRVSCIIWDLVRYFWSLVHL